MEVSRCLSRQGDFAGFGQLRPYLLQCIQLDACVMPARIDVTRRAKFFRIQRVTCCEIERETCEGWGLDFLKFLVCKIDGL